MGTGGRAGVEEVSLVFVSEVMSLVVVGFFDSVAGSSGDVGGVFVTFSVLLW